MTIRSHRPLLYFLLLILLLQWSSNKSCDGAAIYLRGNNYADPFYHDLNYYDALANLEYESDPSDAEGKLMQQEPMDEARVESNDDESAQSLDSDLREPEIMDHEERGGDNEREDGLVLMDNDNAGNRKRDTSESSQGGEQKASLTCQPQTPQQQACLDAAVKDAKDTIEHVTSLIKRMREHAVSIVKDINELEGDFLGACQDDRPKSCPNKPPVSKGKCKAAYGVGSADDSNSAGGGYMLDGSGGFKRIYNDQENNQNNYDKSNNENNNEYNNNNRNSNENQYNADGLYVGQRGENNNNNNNEGNEVGNNKPNTNSKGAPTKPRILMNEYAMPIRTDPADMSHKEFVEQAQYAIHSWKNQIDECKRMLDDAIYHAAQQHQAAINCENPNVKQVVKLIKAPDEVESMLQEYAAPPAAASITPVRSRNAKENSNNKDNANIIDNMNAKNNMVTDVIADPLTSDKSSDAANLKSSDNKIGDDKLSISTVEGSKAVHGDQNSDADTDINDSSNTKRNEDTKKCRSDKSTKKNRAVAPLLSAWQRMGF